MSQNFSEYSAAIIVRPEDCSVKIPPLEYCACVMGISSGLEYVMHAWTPLAAQYCEARWTAVDGSSIALLYRFK